MVEQNQFQCQIIPTLYLNQQLVLYSQHSSVVYVYGIISIIIGLRDFENPKVLFKGDILSAVMDKVELQFFSQVQVNVAARFLSLHIFNLGF